MKLRDQRILHIDGDSFFASCEIALDPKLQNRPVYVGGGRRGDGIVIAANYIAKKYGLKTGMACFEAKRVCPDGVLCKPHYDEYRRLSIEMFRCIRRYTPMLVPTSIDEGFLDFTDSPNVFRCKSPQELATILRKEIRHDIGIPVSAGLASSKWLAKLATETCKPDNFMEVTEADEVAFLKDIPIQKLCGIASRRARSLRALGVWTLGDIAALPLGLMEKRYGFLGLELWLLATGQLRERLTFANKHRTCIGSSTTLPYDEPDYDTALNFLKEQTERVITTFFRENLKAREMGVYVRFKDMEGTGLSVKFPAPMFRPHVILPEVEKMFRQITNPEQKPIRQVCINFWNMAPLDMDPDLFGFNQDLKHRNLHTALEQIEEKFGKRRVITGTRALLEQEAKHLVGDKPKCPFIPSREMSGNVNRVPEEVMELAYEDEWQPLEAQLPDEPLALPRAWGRSTGREQKLS